MTSIEKHRPTKGQSGILIVDDDAVFRGQLAKAFQRRGYDVFEAANQKESLELLSKANCSQAVLDLKLENESGMDILSSIKKSHPALKVVMLTGYGTIATAVQALKIGAVNYITKPADADSILAAFENSNLPTNTAEKVFKPALEQVERDYIQQVISDCNGNITRAAKILGLHRRSLQRKLSKAPQLKK